MYSEIYICIKLVKYIYNITSEILRGGNNPNSNRFAKYTNKSAYIILMGNFEIIF